MELKLKLGSHLLVVGVDRIVDKIRALSLELRRFRRELRGESADCRATHA
jgi:hypothetical protein